MDTGTLCQKKLGAFKGKHKEGDLIPIDTLTAAF